MQASTQCLPYGKNCSSQHGWTVALPTTFGATYLTFFTLHLLSPLMEFVER
jgi:hypothetical protein